MQTHQAKGRICRRSELPRLKKSCRSSRLLIQIALTFIRHMRPYLSDIVLEIQPSKCSFVQFLPCYFRPLEVFAVCFSWGPNKPYFTCDQEVIQERSIQNRGMIYTSKPRLKPARRRSCPQRRVKTRASTHGNESLGLACARLCYFYVARNISTDMDGNAV